MLQLRSMMYINNNLKIDSNNIFWKTGTVLDLSISLQTCSYLQGFSKTPTI